MPEQTTERPADGSQTKAQPPLPMRQPPADRSSKASAEPEDRDHWALRLTGYGLLIGAILALATYWTWTTHTPEKLESRTDGATLLYLLSAIICGGAALLLSGVIGLAPLLSLTLHQSYDSIYDVTSSLFNRTGAQYHELAHAYTRRLRRHLAIYRWLNPAYYAVWIVAVLLLLAMTISLASYPWFSKISYHFSMVFLLLSCILTVAFAGLSVTFFFAVKPGMTKLQLFVDVLESTARENNMIIEKVGVPRRYRVAVFGGIAVAVMTVIGLGRWLAPPAEVLSVGVNNAAVASAPVFMVDDWFAEENRLVVSEKGFAAGRLALDALLGGQVDVATVAETPVLYASINHPDVRIILTIADSQLRIIARRSSAISAVADLRGKKVGTPVGTSAEVFLHRMLAKSGLKDDDVQIINLEPPDTVEAIRSGTVDAVSIWEPHASAAADLQGIPVAIFEDPSAYMEHFNLVTTSKTLADPVKRAALDKFVKASIRASTYINGNKSESIDKVAKRLNAETGQLSMIWNRFSFPAHIDSSLLSDMADIEQWIAGREGRAARPAGQLRLLIDTSILHGVSSERAVVD